MSSLIISLSSTTLAFYMLALRADAQAGFALSIQDVQCGTSHTCVLFKSGKIKCCGGNWAGQLGIENLTNPGRSKDTMKFLPYTDLGTDKKAVKIFAGGYHNCAIFDDNGAKCWGNNIYFQLGYGDSKFRGDIEGTMGDSLPLLEFGKGRYPVKFALAWEHSCVLLDNNALKCYGATENAQVGFPIKFWDLERFPVGDELPSINIGSNRKIDDVVTGQMSSHTCVLLDGGKAKCWGYNRFGQLGYGDTKNRGNEETEMGDNLPEIDLGEGKLVKQIGVGGWHTCALLDNTDAVCWGCNWQGQLAVGTNNWVGNKENQMGSNIKPMKLGSGRHAIDLKVGERHTCAVLDNLDIKCFGANWGGQLGQGDLKELGYTEQTVGDNVKNINLGEKVKNFYLRAGAWFNCVVFEKSRIKCFGYNFDGNLGVGTYKNRGDDSSEVGHGLKYSEFAED